MAKEYKLSYTASEINKKLGEVVDQVFDSESENAQSGKAMAEELSKLPIKKIVAEDITPYKVYIQDLEKGIYTVENTTRGQLIRLINGDKAIGTLGLGTILIVNGIGTTATVEGDDFYKSFIILQQTGKEMTPCTVKCGTLLCSRYYEDEEGNEVEPYWEYESKAGTILTSNDRVSSIPESDANFKVPTVSLVQNMIEEVDTRDLCAPALMTEAKNGFAIAVDVAYEGSPVTVQSTVYSTKKMCKAGVNMCRPFMTVDDNMDFESGSYMHYYEESGIISIKKEVAGDEISFSAKFPLPAGDYFFGANQDSLNNVLSPYITVTNARGETTHYGEPFRQYGYEPMCEVEIKIHIPADVVFPPDWLGNYNFYPQFSVGTTVKKWEKYIEPVEFSVTSGKGTTPGIYPTTTIFEPNTGTQISYVRYSRSLISAYNELKNAIISLGGNV